MKRQISVSIFLSILVIVLAWMYIKYSNETQPKENLISTENDTTKEQSITISQDYIPYKYFLEVRDGKLVVLKSKTQEFFMETSIEFSALPTDIQENVEVGIYFKTEQELYDFLESYSS